MAVEGACNYGSTDARAGALTTASHADGVESVRSKRELGLLRGELAIAAQLERDIHIAWRDPVTLDGEVTRTRVICAGPIERSIRYGPARPVVHAIRIGRWRQLASPRRLSYGPLNLFIDAARRTRRGRESLDWDRDHEAEPDSNNDRAVR